MRTIVLPLLLAAALLSAPVALADDDDRRSERGSEGKAKAAELRPNHAPENDDGNETDDDNAADDGPRGRRNESFRENRTALFDRVIEQLQALRASWLENATKIREDCKSDTFDHRNETKENRTARAHCIRDGYREWRAANTAEIKELREQLRALVENQRGRHDDD